MPKLQLQDQSMTTVFFFFLHYVFPAIKQHIFLYCPFLLCLTKWYADVFRRMIIWTALVIPKWLARCVVELYSFGFCSCNSLPSESYERSNCLSFEILGWDRYSRLQVLLVGCESFRTFQRGTKETITCKQENLISINRILCPGVIIFDYIYLICVMLPGELRERWSNMYWKSKRAI